VESSYRFVDVLCDSVKKTPWIVSTGSFFFLTVGRS
jgi:hypothetical protein